jgi:Trypsin-co-occurring domain 1
MQVPVKTKSGTTFLVEVEESAAPGTRGAVDPGVDPAGRAMGGKLEPTLFTKAVEVIQSVTQEVTEGLLGTKPRPSEVEMTVNIGFDAGGNVWIFKGSTKAALQLVVRWKLP